MYNEEQIERGSENLPSVGRLVGKQDQIFLTFLVLFWSSKKGQPCPLEFLKHYTYLVSNTLLLELFYKL